MNRLFITIALAVFVNAALAAEQGPKLQKANNDLGDRASLQRGARLFVNYCVSCHSAAYMRYNRLAQDLHLSEETVEANLMFTTDKIGDTMKVAMQPADAQRWFGMAPPDLSVIARARGTDWLYTFLSSFYIDEKRPTGVNNIVFADTAMPHVLWELQGLKRPVYHTVTDKHGNEAQVVDHFESVVAGTLTEAEYQQAVRDLVNFLEYIGEPAKLVRYKVGVWVIAYLLVFLIVAYLLKREYWKDVR